MFKIKALRNRYDREYKLLLLDDDEAILKFFKIHLNQFFPKVVATHSGREALSIAEKGEFDLVLADFNLPRMNGITFMRKIRQLDPSVSVILMTGEQLDGHQLKQARSADAFLRKPFTIDEIHQCLNKGLSRRNKIVEFSTLLGDKADLIGVLNGSLQIEVAVNPIDIDKARDLYAELKESQLLPKK